MVHVDGIRVSSGQFKMFTTLVAGGAGTFFAYHVVGDFVSHYFSFSFTTTKYVAASVNDILHLIVQN